MAAGSLLARLLRHGGGRALDRAIGRALPDDGVKPTLLRGVAGAALMRVATRSVPGAIVVGGGLLAKTLYDRRRAKRSPQPPAKPES